MIEALTVTHAPFMERALELAKQAAALGEVPVGAVVVLDGTIVGEGFNRRETYKDPLAHAEMRAITDAAERLGRWRLSECTLYVTLEPCPMCAGALVNSRMDHLVFGARDPKAGAVVSLFELANDARLNHEMSVVEGVHADACALLLKDFFKKRRAENKVSQKTND
jgi:tRNA(adenine34) deaminase